MRLKNRFSELVAEKERRTNRRWTYDDINAATGVSTSTLSAYANNKIRRFDAVTIEALLKFFGCDVSEFFVVEYDEEGQWAAVA